ncbi:MAG: hypothetical protein ACEPOZ_15435 [Marinifilaceae bacterium]
MKATKTSSLALVILSFLFSQIIIFKFNLHDGFSFLGIDIRIRPILDYAGSSTRTYVTSITIGYLLSAAYLLLNFSRAWECRKKLTFAALGICFLGLSAELATWWEDWQGVYQGKHFEVGIPLMILNILLYRELYWSKKRYR